MSDFKLKLWFDDGSLIELDTSQLDPLRRLWLIASEKQTDCFTVHYYSSRAMIELLEYLSGVRKKLTKEALALYSRFADTAYYGYAWFEESCYIDSLLLCLLENKSDFWRDGLLVDPLQISTDIDCPGDLNAKKIRDHLFSDYEHLHWKTEATKCIDVRREIALCEAQMKEEGKYVTYNPVFLYTALVRLFPVLKMKTPIQRWSGNRAVGAVRYDDVTFNTYIPMHNYLYSMTESDDRIEVLWDRIDSPVLVFANEGGTWVKEFSKNISREATKTQLFDYQILNGRYELVGVISNQGGAHYVTYFKAHDSWYYYNDLEREVVKVDKLPMIGVWQTQGIQPDPVTGKTKGKTYYPHIYFYRRL